MKNQGLCVVFAVSAFVAFNSFAEPINVALLDFENKATLSSDTELTAGISADSIAAKGVDALTEGLVKEKNISLIDRRDFIRQTERIELKGPEKTETLKPSFLKAAQAVNADIALRGILMSLQPSKRTVSAGGINSESLVFTVRVALQALDTRDGSVIAMKSGSATTQFRQSDVQKTTVGEDAVYDMLLAAINDAVPDFVKEISGRLEADRDRPMVAISVKTDADPALVEIDGTLVGTTPVEKLEIYKGDHILTVGKPGYRDVNRRIQIDSDTAFEIPMLRTELSADEVKEVMEKMRMDMIIGMPEPPVIIRSFQE